MVSLLPYIIVWLFCVMVTDWLYRHVAAGPETMPLGLLGGYYIALVLIVWPLVLPVALYSCIDRLLEPVVVYSRSRSLRSRKGAFFYSSDSPFSRRRGSIFALSPEIRMMSLSTLRSSLLELL